MQDTTQGSEGDKAPTLAAPPSERNNFSLLCLLLLIHNSMTLVAMSLGSSVVLGI